MQVASRCQLVGCGIIGYDRRLRRRWSRWQQAVGGSSSAGGSLSRGRQVFQPRRKACCPFCHLTFRSSPWCLLGPGCPRCSTQSSIIILRACATDGIDLGCLRWLLLASQCSGQSGTSQDIFICDCLSICSNPIFTLRWSRGLVQQLVQPVVKPAAQLGDHRPGRNEARRKSNDKRRPQVARGLQKNERAWREFHVRNQVAIRERLKQTRGGMHVSAASRPARCSESLMECIPGVCT